MNDSNKVTPNTPAAQAPSAADTAILPRFEAPEGWRVRQPGEKRAMGDMLMSRSHGDFSTAEPVMATEGWEVRAADAFITLCPIERPKDASPAPDAPLPWVANFPEGSNGYWHVRAADGQEIATCYWEGEAGDHAKLIALAVNSHATLTAENDRLRAALTRYGCHVHAAHMSAMCERAKHSDYPCTCGLDEALKFAQAGGAA